MWPFDGASDKRPPTTLFRDQETDLTLHFPSMSFVKVGLAPILYGGQVQRTDGPKWWLRLDATKPFEVVDGEEAHLAARIETAYQVYLHEPRGPLFGSDPAIFYEKVRVFMSLRIGSECGLLLPTDWRRRDRS